MSTSEGEPELSTKDFVKNSKPHSPNRVATEEVVTEVDVKEVPELEEIMAIEGEGKPKDEGAKETEDGVDENKANEEARDDDTQSVDDNSNFYYFEYTMLRTLQVTLYNIPEEKVTEDNFDVRQFLFSCELKFTIRCTPPLGTAILYFYRLRRFLGTFRLDNSITTRYGA